MIKTVTKWILGVLPRPMLIKLSYRFRGVSSLVFRGDNFTDPIDGKNYRLFLPYGYEKVRENVLSPGTLSLERHRLLWLYLKSETDFFTKELKVLHVAPEQCFYSRFKKQKNLEYITTDLESPLAMVKADLCDLPFEDESFDVIFCNHVLEHIVDDKKAMTEMYRVMKKGGFGILQVPISYSKEKTYEDFSITEPEKRKKHFGQYDHVRIYGLDYYDRLESVGFELEKVNLSEKLSKEKVQRFALEKGEILPVVRK